MRKAVGNFCVALAVLLMAVGLVACGGGSGNLKDRICDGPINDCADEE